MKGIHLSATTHAVHLEVVLDLTLDSFMLAFCKFTSHRSTSTTMISDNTSTYLAATEELMSLFQSPSLKTALEHHGVTWNFIPKRAPWLLGETSGTHKAVTQKGARKSICHPASPPNHSSGD